MEHSDHICSSQYFRSSSYTIRLYVDESRAGGDVGDSYPNLFHRLDRGLSVSTSAHNHANMALPGDTLALPTKTITLKTGIYFMGSIDLVGLWAYKSLGPERSQIATATHPTDFHSREPENQPQRQWIQICAISRRDCDDIFQGGKKLDP
jgi:hypothetical protein